MPCVADAVAFTSDPSTSCCSLLPPHSAVDGFYGKLACQTALYCVQPSLLILFRLPYTRFRRKLLESGFLLHDTDAISCIETFLAVPVALAHLFCCCCLSFSKRVELLLLVEPFYLSSYGAALRTICTTHWRACLYGHGWIDNCVSVTRRGPSVSLFFSHISKPRLLYLERNSNTCRYHTQRPRSISVGNIKLILKARPTISVRSSWESRIRYGPDPCLAPEDSHDDGSLAWLDKCSLPSLSALSCYANLATHTVMACLEQLLYAV